MKVENELIVIFGDKKIELDKSGSPTHSSKLAKFIFVTFNESGKVEREIFRRIYLDMFASDPIETDAFFGPFDSINDLKKFCFIVLDEIEGKKVCFVEVSEYNRLIEEVSDSSDLLDVLIKNGDCMDNPSFGQKKGIMDKIFS